MAGNSAWKRMENLIDNGYFTHETLLNEIMHALSSYEADAIFDHIERMHGISDEEEEDYEEEEDEEETDEDIDDADLDDLFGLVDNDDNEE